MRTRASRTRTPSSRPRALLRAVLTLPALSAARAPSPSPTYPALRLLCCSQFGTLEGDCGPKYPPAHLLSPLGGSYVHSLVLLGVAPLVRSAVRRVRRGTHRRPVRHRAVVLGSRRACRCGRLPLLPAAQPAVRPGGGGGQGGSKSGERVGARVRPGDAVVDLAQRDGPLHAVQCR